MMSTTRRGFFTGLGAGLLLLATKVRAGAARVLRPADLESIDAGPGEVIRLLDGARHGYESLSVILSESAPGGGPPLHTHDCEEVHIVEAGRVTYLVDGEQFTLDGPYLLRIPAHAPHAFINAGPTPVRITAAFGSPRYSFHFLGPNPLWAKTGPGT